MNDATTSECMCVCVCIALYMNIEQQKSFTRASCEQ